MDLADVKTGFIASGLPPAVISELLTAYAEAKRRFHLGDHRPQAVEGGRFSEAAFRLLQHATGHPVTPLGKTLPTVDKLLSQFENSQTVDALRLHIPRTLKLIYDIRNKRDVAHLGDGIDPNRQDATLIVGCMDWALAELVRLYHSVSPNSAQQIIEDLISKEVPAVQEIGGQPVILRDLGARDQALLMLYRAGASGATLDELAGWLRASRKDHLKTRLLALDQRKLVLHHPTTGRFYLTSLGMKDVESRNLAKPV
ncbi:MAG TPA: hypothetical protein VGX28_02095 [Frankiaceae bacterium]|nr:hypothetical protein [Frankiaceae bacterium]